MRLCLLRQPGRQLREPGRPFFPSLWSPLKGVLCNPTKMSDNPVCRFLLRLSARPLALNNNVSFRRGTTQTVHALHIQSHRHRRSFHMLRNVVFFPINIQRLLLHASSHSSHSSLPRMPPPANSLSFYLYFMIILLIHAHTIQLLAHRSFPSLSYHIVYLERATFPHRFPKPESATEKHRVRRQNKEATLAIVSCPLLLQVSGPLLPVLNLTSCCSSTSQTFDLSRPRFNVSQLCLESCCFDISAPSPCFPHAVSRPLFNIDHPRSTCDSPLPAKSFRRPPPPH